MKNEKGITLIALIITVIILGILGSVAISQIGTDGIFDMTDEIEERANTVFSENDANAYGIVNEIKRQVATISEEKGSITDIAWTYDHGTQTITKGSLTLHVGDYINYDHKTIVDSANGTYTVDTTKTGSTGTAEAFNVVNYNGGWRVIGVDDENRLMLISERVVGNLSLSGKTGYATGIKELNKVCAIYGHGKRCKYCKKFNNRGTR